MNKKRPYYSYALENFLFGLLGFAVFMFNGYTDEQQTEPLTSLILPAVALGLAVWIFFSFFDYWTEQIKIPRQKKKFIYHPQTAFLRNQGFKPYHNKYLEGTFRGFYTKIELNFIQTGFLVTKRLDIEMRTKTLSPETIKILNQQTRFKKIWVLEDGLSIPIGIFWGFPSQRQLKQKLNQGADLLEDSIFE